MTDTLLKQQFKATVESSLADLQSLLELLERERCALTAVDIETIETVSQEKMQMLEALEASVLARESLLKQAGLESGLPGGRLFIREHFHPDEMLEPWQHLEQLSAQVQSMNNDNAKLALSGERHARDALGILTGRSTDADTYGNKANKKLGGYSLGKC